MRTVGGVAAIVLIAIVAGGCGGGGSERLTKAELDRRADAICAKYNRRLKAVFRTERATPRAISDALARAIPLVERGLKELRALEPPDDLADDYTHWLDLNAKSIPVVRRLRDSARRADEQDFRLDLARLARQERRQNALARKLGFAECASG